LLLTSRRSAVPSIDWVGIEGMAKRIYYDGLNLALPRGTGIMTYARVLIRLARELGNEVGIIYNYPRLPPSDSVLREVSFFDALRPTKSKPTSDPVTTIVDQVRALRPIRPTRVDVTNSVLRRAYEPGPEVGDRLFVTRNLFKSAVRHFRWTGRFTLLDFDERPDLFHCTCPTPLSVTGALNIYTIHDLVPLKLPFASADNKRTTYAVLKKIVAEADHIVTVSESSRRDIIDVLGVAENRVTNTYQAVLVSNETAQRPEDELANELEAFFGLEYGDYLLFYGALEPKKNVGRIIEAYFRSGVVLPLVLVTSGGWGNEVERNLLAEVAANQRGKLARGKPSVRHYDYVGTPMLSVLIRGARAGVFPSLYEGFGLPVLECMMLGTPVVTSREGALPEVAGDAALFVDPYDVSAIAAALRTIVHDTNLHAELAHRSKIQAEKFSFARYRDRVRQLYDRII